MIMNSATTELLMHAAEVWIPSEDGTHLCWYAGEYKSDPSIAERRKHLTWAAGQGIAGKCWKDQSPAVVNGVAADLGEGFSDSISAIAIPTRVDGECHAVAVLYCGIGEIEQGALEVWRINDRHELGLAESAYMRLDRFSRVSKYVNFPRRAGLPGMVWANRSPKLLEGVGKSRDFMRAAGARAGGLDIGVGLPVMRSGHELDSVVILLSSEITPMAKVFEIWLPEEFEEIEKEDGFKLRVPTSLKLDHGAQGEHESLKEKSQVLLHRKDGIAGMVLETGLPQVVSNLEIETQRSEELAAADCTSGLGIPIFAGEELVAVFVMMF